MYVTYPIFLNIFFLIFMFVFPILLYAFVYKKTMKRIEKVKKTSAEGLLILERFLQCTIAYMLIVTICYYSFFCYIVDLKVSNIYNIKIDETSPVTKIEYTRKNNNFLYKSAFTEYIIKDPKNSENFIVSDQEESVLNPNKSPKNIREVFSKRYIILDKRTVQQELSLKEEKESDSEIKDFKNVKVRLDDLNE